MTRRVFVLSRWFFVALIVALTIGCSATGARLKAYEGPDLPASATATLEAPDNIRVLLVNNEKVSSFLLKDLALEFSLKPGPNDVVFQYRSIWARKDVRRDGDSAVDVVESDPMVVSFEAQADRTYTFEFEEASNVREARNLASNFSAELVDGARTVAVAAPPGERTEVAESPAALPEVVASENAKGEPGVPSGLSTLEALNLLWERASKEEKEAFLQQAFD